MTGREHAVLVRLKDALEDGDVGFARELLEVLDDGPRLAPGYGCSGCSRRFDWPGQRDDHEAIAHGVYREDLGLAA